MLRVSEFRLFVRLPSALLVGGASTAAADSAYFCMRVETSLESASFGRLAFITSAAASIVSSRTSERDTVAISRWSGAFEQRCSGRGWSWTKLGGKSIRNCREQIHVTIPARVSCPSLRFVCNLEAIGLSRLDLT